MTLSAAGQTFLDGLRSAFAQGGVELRPGELAEPVRVPLKAFRSIWQHELAPIDIPRGWCVWPGLGSEIAVHVVESSVALRTGYVLAALLTRCDEVGQARLVVPLATGTETATPVAAGPAGLMMTAEATARGVPLLVDVWGEVAVTACWAAVVGVARSVAAAAGEDRCGCPLIPGAIRAADDEFIVVPQARHAIDRPDC